MRKLKILFVSQYFPPEVAAPAVRVYETSREWVKLGHKVTVLCGFPHHPTGIVPKRYKDFLVKKEKWDGIDVVRTCLYPAPNKGFFRRSLTYLSFMFSAIISGMVFVRKPDVVIATSPQLLVGVAGWVLAKLKRCPFVFEVRDLWPETLQVLGLRNPIALSLLKQVAQLLYKKSDMVVCASPAFIPLLKKWARRIELVENGVDTSFLLSDAPESSVFFRQQRKTVSYVGTLGMCQDLGYVVDVAKDLKDLDFIFVGDGAEKTKLIQLAENADNISFVGQVERSLVPGILKRSDAVIVVLKNNPFFETVIPTKLIEALGSGSIVVAACSGVAADIAKEGGALVVPPGDSAALKQALKTALFHSEFRLTAQMMGPALIHSRFDRKQLAYKYAKLLGELVRANRYTDSR